MDGDRLVRLYDVTLRDGNHALRHALDPGFVRRYCAEADGSGVWAVEVGHGNGLGASSHLVGRSSFADETLLMAAREQLTRTRLAVHSIPGFATIARDLVPAIECGVEVFRVATHVTEATVAQTHIEFLADQGVTVHGVLMMSHMADTATLCEQAELMKRYGASAVVMMDSAGHLVPAEVAERVRAVRETTGVAVGFHAHNNLGVAVANAIAALENEASILDGAAMGLGAGAGNAQLEAVSAAFLRSGHANADLQALLTLSTLVETDFPDQLPRVTASSVESGMAGVFSGYAPQVRQISSEYGIEIATLWSALADRKLVAGQESMIREIAQDLMNL